MKKCWFCSVYIFKTIKHQNSASQYESRHPWITDAMKTLEATFRNHPSSRNTCSSSAFCQYLTSKGMMQFFPTFWRSLPSRESCVGVCAVGSALLPNPAADSSPASSLEKSAVFLKASPMRYLSGGPPHLSRIYFSYRPHSDLRNHKHVHKRQKVSRWFRVETVSRLRNRKFVQTLSRLAGLE